MAKLNPYLNFQGNTREVMEFYKSVFGGNLVMNSFKDFNMLDNSDELDWLMHSQLDAENGMTIMAADLPTSHGQLVTGKNISLSVSGDDEAEIRGYWDKLAEGANVAQPLVQAPWGDTFGMLTDKFGIQWLFNIAGKKA